MIVLFTDFSLTDPYLGQVKNILLQNTKDTHIVDLLHNAPAFDIKSSAYLLEAYSRPFPADAVFLCVVDPGVGSTRKPCAIKINNQWFIGPENGLFNVLLARNTEYKYFHLTAPSNTGSVTFDGRDLFAPVAAQLAMNQSPEMNQHTVSITNLDSYSRDYPHIIYIDHYGNLISGYRYQSLTEDPAIFINGTKLKNAKTFSDVAIGEAFYYCNANGLLEISVNQGSAADFFRINIGDIIDIR